MTRRQNGDSAVFHAYGNISGDYDIWHNGIYIRPCFILYNESIDTSLENRD